MRLYILMTFRAFSPEGAFAVRNGTAYDFAGRVYAASADDALADAGVTEDSTFTVALAARSHKAIAARALRAERRAL